MPLVRDKIGTVIQLVLVITKMEQADVEANENKPAMVNQQCTVYSFFSDVYNGAT